MWWVCHKCVDDAVKDVEDLTLQGGSLEMSGLVVATEANQMIQRAYSQIAGETRRFKSTSKGRLRSFHALGSAWDVPLYQPLNADVDLLFPQQDLAAGHHATSNADVLVRQAFPSHNPGGQYKQVSE